MFWPTCVCRVCFCSMQVLRSRSLLMDYVPKEARGRWNSLDSVLAFGWCGSAVAGGFLLDAFGFGEVVYARGHGGYASTRLPLLLMECEEGHWTLVVTSHLCPELQT